MRTNGKRFTIIAGATERYKAIADVHKISPEEAREKYTLPYGDFDEGCFCITGTGSDWRYYDPIEDKILDQPMLLDFAELRKLREKQKEDK